jgi:hypothetical protein
VGTLRRVTTLIFLVGTTLVASPEVALGMPCVGTASNPDLIQVNQEFFTMESFHSIVCDASTAIIHVIGEMTRDGVLVAAGSADCVQRSSCGPVRLTHTHARHQHQHLWHGWTSGWHKHHSGDSKRWIVKKRSNQCTETNLRPLLGSRAIAGPTCSGDSLSRLRSVAMSTTGPDHDTLVSAGPGWSMTARAEGGKVFLNTITRNAGSAGATTFGAPGQGSVITWGGHVAADKSFFLSGFAIPQVARVQVLLDSGGNVVVSTTGADAGFSVVFYVAKLPSGSRPIAITAFDKDGGFLEELDTSLALEV